MDREAIQSVDAYNRTQGGLGKARSERLAFVPSHQPGRLRGVRSGKNDVRRAIPTVLTRPCSGPMTPPGSLLFGWIVETARMIPAWYGQGEASFMRRFTSNRSVQFSAVIPRTRPRWSGAPSSRAIRGSMHLWLKSNLEGVRQTGLGRYLLG